MSEQKERIYNTKSIQHRTSQEHTDDYIRTANPGVWLIVAAVLLLIVAVAVWGYVW